MEIKKHQEWIDIAKGVAILLVVIGHSFPDAASPSICIGDNCYIGTGVTILGPIKIGNNVTIGAGSIVVKDVPDNAVIAGNQARIIRYKD
jgi:serine O-acetyltransferase